MLRIRPAINRIRIKPHRARRDQMPRQDRRRSENYIASIHRADEGADEIHFNNPVWGSRKEARHWAIGQMRVKPGACAYSIHRLTKVWTIDDDGIVDAPDFEWNLVECYVVDVAEFLARKTEAIAP